MARTFFIVAVLIALIALFSDFGGGDYYDRRQPDAMAKVTISSGDIVGFEDIHNTFAWLGIPYAGAPQGEWRWRAPRAVAAWEQVRGALEFGPMCPQLQSIFSGVKGKGNGVLGSEDCLSLNIWAPKDALGSTEKPLPVMFWIHGGSNKVGSGSAYPAPHLSGSQEVVVVSINYRLGALGWFSHSALRETAATPEEASGNFAVLDMVAALEWVRDNIAQFGGDPDRVTIFGESAGGRNVFALMVSPLAKGLFHRAISQSGSISSQTRTLAEHYVDDQEPGLPNSSGERVAALLVDAGLASDRDSAKTLHKSLSDQDLNQFLRSQTSDQLLREIGPDGSSLSAPQLFRDGIVLPDTPLTEVLADPARYNSVPLITGANRDEQKLFMALNPKYSNALFKVIPRIDDQETFNRDSAYLSDRWRLTAVDMPATIIATNGGAPVYSYRWDWDEGGDAWLVNWSTALGAAHGMELPFVFGDFDRIVPIPFLFNNANRAGAERLSSQMMAYWANFARNGEPGRGAGTAPLWQAWNAPSGGIMLLDTEADGGVRASSDRLSVPDFTDRLIKDASFSTVKERCVMFVDLFYTPRRGREFFDRREYERLGCAEFDAAALVGVSGR